MPARLFGEQPRRPTSRTAQRDPFADSSRRFANVLEDSDLVTRYGSRARKRAATESTIATEDGKEESKSLVITNQDGGYIRQIPLPDDLEETEHTEEHILTATIKEYWLSNGRGRKFDDDSLEKLRLEANDYMREAVVTSLNEKQWMYASTDLMEELRVASHGRV